VPAPEPGGHGSPPAALRAVSCAARSWPELNDRQRAAAFATAIDAVEAVQWVPIEEQDHLLAAKVALLAGTADGLTGDERRRALDDAAEELARLTTRRRSGRSNG
jgi:hypothetical protein